MQLYWGTCGLVATEVMIFLIPMLYAIYIKADIKNTFSLRLPKLRYILGGFIVWFGGYFIINITTRILISLFPEGADVLEAVNSSVMMDSFFASLIVVALIPAICEEILFRGFLLGAFKCESKKSNLGSCNGRYFIWNNASKLYKNSSNCNTWNIICLLCISYKINLDQCIYAFFK